MELRTVDPRTLRNNPDNPRRTTASPEADAMLEASVKAIGIIQPPVVRPDDGGLMIVAGHRRVVAAIAAELAEIHVLVTEHADGSDDMRSLSENIARAVLNPVDQWRAIQRLVDKDWTEPAIAAALALPVRTVQKLRLLGGVHPAMLDHMARGDMPADNHLRTIASAPQEEQVSVWKKHRPRKGETVAWYDLARALSKRRMMAKHARFGEELAKAYRIPWTDDLFAPADEDGRHTTDVEAFYGAQMEWLRDNLPAKGIILTISEHGEPILPKGVQRLYYNSGTPKKGDHSGWYLHPSTGEVAFIPYRLDKPAAQRKGAVNDEPSDDAGAPRPRPPITRKGETLLGQLRTQALHEALADAPMTASLMTALLILGYAGTNVAVSSARATSPYAHARCAGIARRLFADGALVTDPATLDALAREMLAEILSCRDDRTNSGVIARLAGQALKADTYLPNLATEEVLSCVSRELLEKAAVEHNIAPRPRVRDTRAALIQTFSDEARFYHPIAGFTPDVGKLASFLGGDDDEFPDAEPGEADSASGDPADGELDEAA